MAFWFGGDGRQDDVSGSGGGRDYEDEEEEEEEDPRWQRPPASNQRAAAEEDEEESECDGPGDEEDLLRAAGNLAGGIWEYGVSLRSRRAVAAAGDAPVTDDTSASFASRSSLWHDSDSDFALGSERLEHHPGQRLEVQSSSIWQQVSLAVLILAGLLAAAADRKPSEESFHAVRNIRYSALENVSKQPSWPLLADKSFSGRVVKSTYVAHGPIALASVRLTVSLDQGVANKTKQSPHKNYEHWYFGVLGQWLPLPYLPQPGQKLGTYGVGMCMLGRCICIPPILPPKAAKKGKDAKEDKSAISKSGKRSSRECQRFNGGKSAALNCMVVPNALLFFAWQWPSYWSVLSAHATISIKNLQRGHVWVLFVAPFSHRSWGEIFRSGVLLTSALDSFYRLEVSFVTFLLLYIGGCWVAWLVRGILWRRVILGDRYASYTQEWGASGGLAAQLVFLARARPEERFHFSLYFVPVPVELSAWQSVFAQGLLDVFMGTRDRKAEVVAHLGAWFFGWLVYDAWMKHN